MYVGGMLLNVMEARKVLDNLFNYINETAEGEERAREVTRNMQTRSEALLSHRILNLLRRKALWNLKELNKNNHRNKDAQNS